MKIETINRENLSQSIAEKVGLSYAHSSKILEKVLEIMMEGLAKDGQLKLMSFDSFVILHKNKRVGRNPSTGQEVMITPHKSVSFKASEKIKLKIAKN